MLLEGAPDFSAGKFFNTEQNTFHEFPSGPEWYAYDIRSMVSRTIEKYGPEEWRSVVLTNEIHGHLGIYSIIGVKMGIRALEYLQAPRNMVKIKSYAGYETPFSCMNDGLQVSTGSTLGQGLIGILHPEGPELKVLFLYDENQVILSLKEDYRKEAISMIRESKGSNGILNEAYWVSVRHSALKVWSDWDRNRIFSITADPQKHSG